MSHRSRIIWLVLATGMAACDAHAELLGIPEDPTPLQPPPAFSPEPSPPRAPPLRSRLSPPLPDPDTMPNPPGQRPLQEKPNQVTAPPLPKIELPPDATANTAEDTTTPKTLLASARAAIDAGRRDKAIDLIDRAQVRLLSRSVALFRTMDQINDTAVDGLTEAKRALMAGDRQRAIALIAQASTSVP